MAAQSLPAVSRLRICGTCTRGPVRQITRMPLACVVLSLCSLSASCLCQSLSDDMLQLIGVTGWQKPAMHCALAGWGSTVQQATAPGSLLSTLESYVRTCSMTIKEVGCAARASPNTSLSSSTCTSAQACHALAKMLVHSAAAVCSCSTHTHTHTHTADQLAVPEGVAAEAAGPAGCPS